MIISRRDATLTVIVLSVIALAIMLRPSSYTAPESTRQPVMPDLKDRLNAVDEVVISKGELTTTIVSNDSGAWSVKERYHYPASTKDLRRLLLMLSNSELRDEKTADPQKLSRIGLTDEQAQHIHINNNGETLHHLLIGNVGQDRITTFVRYADNTQSYSAGGNLTVDSNPIEWLFPDLFSINRKRVQTVRYIFDGKKDYNYSRNTPDATMTLSPIPSGKKLKSLKTPTSASYYLERLTFSDVLPASAKKGAVSNNITVVETFGGLKITITFYTINQRSWAAFSAEYDANSRNDALKDLPPPSQLQAETLAINERTNGWIYYLGQFNYNQLRASYYDLVELQ